MVFKSVYSVSLASDLLYKCLNIVKVSLCTEMICDVKMSTFVDIYHIVLDYIKLVIYGRPEWNGESKSWNCLLIVYHIYLNAMFV